MLSPSIVHQPSSHLISSHHFSSPSFFSSFLHSFKFPNFQKNSMLRFFSLFSVFCRSEKWWKVFHVESIKIMSQNVRTDRHAERHTHSHTDLTIVCQHTTNYNKTIIIVIVQNEIPVISTIMCKILLHWVIWDSCSVKCSTFTCYVCTRTGYKSVLFPH